MDKYIETLIKNTQDTLIVTDNTRKDKCRICKEFENYLDNSNIMFCQHMIKKLNVNFVSSLFKK